MRVFVVVRLCLFFFVCVFGNSVAIPKMLGISSAVLSLARQQATLQPQDAEDPRCAELDKRLDLADLSVQSFAGATYCAGITSNPAQCSTNCSKFYLSSSNGK